MRLVIFVQEKRMRCKYLITSRYGGGGGGLPGLDLSKVMLDLHFQIIGMLLLWKPIICGSLKLNVEYAASIWWYNYVFVSDIQI